ncbi:DUF59 domain-containing protein [Saccharopolyspora aridisoli]|uniref:DUF59 domain-containing protein n=1 Tax=Saccharopolyspora aridisoli TaxID=2530385 RepID=A0A4R4V163_9PSEU|nr:iron-sulfur cluster assembly protein [Saccharopolyspora aridisoli]TDC96756.1 DUF59 domain-containing protein [Saccharopolyspora aridisoli]
MTAGLERSAWEALHQVIDPELDEPITDLGFVRSLRVDDSGEVEAHLRLPTSFCAPNFAYLMASDAKDVLRELPGVTGVLVELDDHHDSELINAGLAGDAGYRDTFPGEAEQDLEELRATFRRKAHAAAMERVLTRLLKDRPELDEADLHAITVADLPDEPATCSLLDRREAVGFDNSASALVLVDDEGRPCTPEQVPFRLRFARATRISVEGNSHFCRGLLRTRYPESAADQAPRAMTSEGLAR